jgi:hypothetical protein
MMSYECHVTTTVAHAEAAEVLARALGWKTSEIKRDPVLGDGSHFYLTTHGNNFVSVKIRMHTLADSMKACGIPVVREKIERIVYDTKTGVGIDQEISLRPPTRTRCAGRAAGAGAGG